MKTIIKREITLTLDDSEAGQLRDLMLNCPSFWNSDLEISDDYDNTVLPELWQALNSI